MKKFGARRVPRKIGGADDDDENEQSSSTEPVLKRPSTSTANKTKKRQSSSLRLSFDPSAATVPGAADDDGNDTTTADEVFTPVKSTLSRLAQERTAAAAARKRNLPVRAGGDQPNYSREALEELKGATPSTPRSLQALGPGSGGGSHGGSGDDATKPAAVDIAAKFGAEAALAAERRTDDQRHPRIPTEAEIREKKERRRRLAREGEFISLRDRGSSDSEEEDGDEEEDRGFASDESDQFRTTTSTTTRSRHGGGSGSRLVREDEDLAEGFDELVEDGGIALGPKAERDAARKRREEMAALIAEAEGGNGGDADTHIPGALDDSSSSEAERNAAYEAAQTRAGTFGIAARPAATTDDDLRRPRTPPTITPLPDLGDVLAKLHAALHAMEDRRAGQARRLAELGEERAALVDRAAWVQRQLTETARRYEAVRGEAGLGGGEGDLLPTAVTTMGDGRVVVQRGLESLGATPVRAAAVVSEGEEDGEGGRLGLGAQ